jgi:phospholipid transport system substrate-binding protein
MGPMHRSFLFWLTAVLLSFVLDVSAWAGKPLEQVKETTDKILSILNNPSLKVPGKAEEQKRLIWKAVDERFDWEELSRRSLGPHWTKIDSEDRKEFINLYSTFLRQIYLNKVEYYSGENVRYERERIDGDYAVVEVWVITRTGKEIPATYRLKRKGADWRVYDIWVLGVSLVRNYRAQFNSIIARSSYEELVRLLKQRTAKEE